MDNKLNSETLRKIAKIRKEAEKLRDDVKRLHDARADCSNERLNSLSFLYAGISINKNIFPRITSMLQKIFVSDQMDTGREDYDACDSSSLSASLSN